MPKMLHTFAVYPNPAKDSGFAVTREAAAVLLGCGADIRLPASLRAALASELPSSAAFVPDEMLSVGVDCAVVLGGDGSVIKAASACAEAEIPILGINLGRVGYLAEVEQDELYLLSRLCRGEYRTERRMMLDVSVLREGTIIHTMPRALNEAVISNGAISHMVELSVRCDGQTVSQFHADGIIAATPTGSTAYSMSAGGPIIDPTLDCFCLTPVCAHSLRARPMLLSSGCTLEIENICRREDNTYLTVDGAANFKLLCGDKVVIRRSARHTAMIRFHENSFFSVLSRKMQ